MRTTAKELLAQRETYRRRGVRIEIAGLFLSVLLIPFFVTAFAVMTKQRDEARAEIEMLMEAPVRHVTVGSEVFAVVGNSGPAVGVCAYGKRVVLIVEPKVEVGK